MKIRDEDALAYHEGPRRHGKIEVRPSKACLTQRDLALAYTPGVAVPCRRIHDDPTCADLYTARANLVAVISNGTAVLGLGDIGPLAGKPVMEGKGVLFKRFADIDVFDIELATKDVDEFVRTVRLMEPTFGGINLEDIAAPACFEIERRLQEEMDIPVFHDDQHGTAIISGAALLNALLLVDKRIEDVRVVVSGAGASGIACARFYTLLGVRHENVTMCDSTGVVYRGRERGMNPYKEAWAVDTKARTLADAMRDADVFLGLSGPGLVTPDMVRSMAPDPIVFALANPDPEIDFEAGRNARPDVIMATGRSDYPNQVNNVLGFPFIFRGALDVGARRINDEMKLAAARALATLAQEDVPDSVRKAYGGENLRFGRDYIIPKPFDPRVLLWEAPAVAAAATATGVARRPLTDGEAYRESLERLLGRSREVMRVVIHQAQAHPHRIVFPEGEEPTVLRACQILVDQHIARPILVGDSVRIRSRIRELDLEMEDYDVENPVTSPQLDTCARSLYELRGRKGLSTYHAAELARDPLWYGLWLVRNGLAEGLVAGVHRSYPEIIRPTLQVMPLRPGVRRAAGMYAMILPERVLFFADATVNIDPDAETLAEIARLAAEGAQELFHVTPRVAMLSFSNFGEVRHPACSKVRQAVEMLRRTAPGLLVDGEMMADTALVPEIVSTAFPQSRIAGDANVLVFPDLQAGNIAYKLIQHLAGADIVGPILLGLEQPVNVVNHYSTVDEVVNMAAVTVAAAAVRKSKGSLDPASRPNLEPAGARR
jgi:malate dehydrogenase (oxaloacetate-decarboxylating)(NADP+)